MPSHARQQIRYAFRDLLLGGAIWGDRVFTGRSIQFAAKEMPGLLIVTPRETSQVSARDTALKYERVPEVEIVGYALGRDVLDRLDAIALEIEQTVAAAAEDSTSDLMALVKDVQLARTEVRFDTSLEQEAGEIRLIYAVLYRTTNTAPQTAIA